MRIDGGFQDDAGLAQVADMLRKGGHQALIVGGAVRNRLLGLPASDLDLATDAPPDRVIGLARTAGLKPVPTGIDHGTVTVIADGCPYEITTFRRDVDTDGRHAVVAFSDRIEDDARRRDFTMNAIYATPEGEVIDPVGGLPDLQNRHLRFVGDPATRIAEDYLRILRYFRFLAWYTDPRQPPDPAALRACAQGAPGLSRISRERIGAEMRKLLSAPDPSAAIGLAAEAGVLQEILPGADPAALPPLVALEHGLAPDWLRRLVALGGKDPTDALRLSRAESRRWHDLSRAVTAGWPAAVAGYRLGDGQGESAVLIAAARHGVDLPPGWRGQVARGAAAAPLPLTGADLSDHLSGPALGRGLRAAEKLWIASDFSADRDALIAAATRPRKAEPGENGGMP
ncbi:CCA tRNA nucleotidyltransferase [Paracoccus pacificus]|uniref:CCA tRNA nucleotidyltransferase n=1 Tax=Paracoccus pacificus TaxID=1463598 RepID=A0ABW4R8Y8_9RHOB